jgi:hypothetical protein
MRFRVDWTLLAFLWFAFTMGGIQLFAQAPSNTQGVQPRRPVLSPYLNLGLENRDAPLPSYQQFVLPRMTLDQQQIGQWRLQNRTGAIESTLRADAQLRPTGKNSRYQNYLHFYPSREPRR